MKHKLEKLFVPYELAVLAKNKGFHEECLTCYTNTYTKEMLHTIERINNYNQYPLLVSAPLYQQLIDWFREEYNIYIYVDSITSADKHSTFYRGCIKGINNSGVYRNSSSAKEYIMEFGLSVHKSYNEALTEAIKEAFKLI